ncbi:MAG: hypothetical protein RL077_2162 [Verrucomicrobiota bacterium]|jgi:hypothetical protein
MMKSSFGSSVRAITGEGPELPSRGGGVQAGWDTGPSDGALNDELDELISREYLR